MSPKQFKHELLESDLQLEQITKPEGRYYTEPGVSNRKYPSVTTVLKELKGPDYSKIPEFYKKRGSMRGNYMHDFAEQYVLNNQAIPIPPCRDLREMDLYNTGRDLFYQIKPFLDKNIDAVYMTEKRLKSEKYRIAGTVDLFARIAGKNLVTDYKSSTQRREEKDIESYFCQGTFYKEAIEEEFGIHVDGILVLISTENEGYQPLLLKCDSPKYKNYKRMLANARKSFYKNKGY